MNRYAFSIQFEPSSNFELLAGRCLKILHGYQCKHKINIIGSTFPEFSDESIGGSIAFVSSYEGFLKDLQQQHYFQQMQNLGKFLISDHVLVSESVSEVRFLRERTRDKNCAGGKQRSIRRGQRRAENAGYEYQPYREEVTSSRRIQIYHNVPMTSSENAAKVYYLRIQKHKAEQLISNGYTSYGLSNQAELNGTVPEHVFTYAL